MSERCQGSVRCSCDDLQAALSIHTRKITDSCRDKDCIADLRVYLTRSNSTQPIFPDAYPVHTHVASVGGGHWGDNVGAAAQQGGE